jgi:hypothetical protein
MPHAYFLAENSGEQGPRRTSFQNANRPSPSESTFGSDEITVRVLLAEGIDVELPDAFLAIRVTDPIALEPSDSVMVAEVPPVPIVTFEKK